MLHKTTAMALLVGVGLAAAGPLAAQPAPQNDTQCRSVLAGLDANKDQSVDAAELAPHRARVFAAMDQNQDQSISRDEYRGCIGVVGQDQAAVDQSYVAFDADRDGRVTREEFLAEGKLERTKVGVQQESPVVRVAQDAPTVRVDQAPPAVRLNQPAPTVHVEQQQPTISVQQPQPTVTVQQAQPVVRVEQPQPIVRVEQPPPIVRVEQAKPEVIVEQAQPKVEVQQAQPKVEVQQAQPKVTVEQAQPKVEVQQAQPKVEVQQAEPKVQVQQAEAPRVITDRPNAGAEQRAAQPQANRTAQTQPAAGTNQSSAQTLDKANLRASELVGKDVVTQQGRTLGDIEDVVISKQNQALHAVISVGGFLGIGERHVAVPFGQLRLDQDKVILMSEQSEDSLKQMPAYNREQFTRVEAR